jgi:hypothetical protein
MTSTSQPTAHVEGLIKEASERWRLAGGVPESDLLRLSIARDLMHALHAQKSRFLAQGQRDQASTLRDYEAKMEEIRTSAPLSAGLEEIFAGTAKLKKRTRILPEPLFSVLEREKLERYDRTWEAALASESCHLGWSFWSLEARLDIQKIEEWNRRLAQRLWPGGIVLFVESISLDPVRTTPESGSAEKSNSTSWLGRWITLMHPRFQAAPTLLSEVNEWPGTRAPIAWKLLFFPKNR